MSAATANGGRLSGLDLARALAMIGMLMVHIGPTHLDDLAGRLYALPHGRASILFMLVAGVGVSMLAASRRLAWGGTAARLAWRALLLFPLGLALQALDPTGPHVILQTYALLFVLAVGLVHLPGRALLVLAASAAVAGPIGYLAGGIHAHEHFNRSPILPGDTACEMISALVATGPYPLITWIVPFVLGIWLGRCDLRGGRTRLWLILGGGAVALALAGIGTVLHAVFGEPVRSASWGWLMAVNPHSQMPLWLWGATATAMAVLGLCLVLGDLCGRWLWPLAATGQVALSFYVGHLLALAWWPGGLRASQPVDAAELALAVTLVVMAHATAWRWLFARGPLELFLHLPWAGQRRNQ